MSVLEGKRECACVRISPSVCMFAGRFKDLQAYKQSGAVSVATPKISSIFQGKFRDNFGPKY